MTKTRSSSSPIYEAHPAISPHFCKRSSAERGYRRRAAVIAILVTITASVSGCSSGEREAFSDFEAAVARAQTIDARANSDAAMMAYQEVVDAAVRYLDQYPDGSDAADVRSKQENFAANLRSMREAISEYQKNLKKEINEAEPQLPSECGRMAKMWEDYAGKFPHSKFADAVRQRKSRWEAKLQEEIARGFQLVIEDAQIQRVKGHSHGWMEGHPWDPEIFGASALPDAYAVLVMNGQAQAYGQVVQDSLHPVWKQKVPALQVSDEQEVTIAVRDRDVAEKASVLLMGKGLFTFSGIAAASAALKQDNDDDICRWTGTIRELLEKGASGLGRVGDCEQLRVTVRRPR